MASLPRNCSIYLAPQAHPYSSLARSVCPVCSPGPASSYSDYKAHSSSPPPTSKAFSGPPFPPPQLGRAKHLGGGDSHELNAQGPPAVCSCDGLVLCLVWFPIILGTSLILQVGKLGLAKRKGLPRGHTAREWHCEASSWAQGTPSTLWEQPFLPQPSQSCRVRGLWPLDRHP